MDDNKKDKLKSRIINFIFFGVLLFFLVSTPAKSWLLRGLVSTGLFSAKIERAGADKTGSTAAMNFRNDDGSFESTESLKGRVVFINFWASWCPPCRAEMPSVNKMYQKLRNDPEYAFIFINLDDDAAAARKYLEANHFELPIQKPAGFIPTDLYTGTLPTTVVLNKKGAIVMKHTGMANYNSPGFIKQLESLR